MENNKLLYNAVVIICSPLTLKWFTERFYTDAKVTDEVYPDTDTDDKTSPTVIDLLTCSIFYPDAQCGYWYWYGDAE